MTENKTIWFDITNVPHVNFLLPIIRKYEGEFDMVFTVRDFAETVGLFEKRIGRPYICVGEHQGGNKLKKLYSNAYHNPINKYHTLMLKFHLVVILPLLWHGVEAKWL